MPRVHDGSSKRVNQKPEATKDPRICRVCGERVLDMKYHLGKAHPRSAAGRPTAIRLDPGSEEALRTLSGLLEEMRDNVFKEPLRTTQIIDRARQWVAWARDRTQPRPSPYTAAPPAVTDIGPAKRHDMRAPPKPPAKKP